MAKRITASRAKNNFGGLLEDVAELGRVEIVRHGRLVAVMLSPRALEHERSLVAGSEQPARWGESHMIPARNARAARLVSVPSDFDEG